MNNTNAIAHSIINIGCSRPIINVQLAEEVDDYEDEELSSESNRDLCYQFAELTNCITNYQTF